MDPIELEDFYKRYSQKLTPILSEIGHFNMFRLDDLILPQRESDSYSKRNFYKVSLVTGHSKILYADQTFDLDGTVLVFTNPMVPFDWHILSPSQTGFVCIFTAEFLGQPANLQHYPVFQQASHSIIPLNPDKKEVYTGLFQRMFDELQSDYAFKYDSLKNFLGEIIHSAQKMQSTQGIPISYSNATDRISSLFLELLERQFPIELNNQVMQIRTPDDFAGQLHIHVNHLNKALKKSTGKTTSQLISERIILEAKIILKNTTWTVSEIAWGLGFKEPNHFSVFFKKHTALSPKQFRNSEID